MYDNDLRNYLLLCALIIAVCCSAIFCVVMIDRRTKLNELSACVDKPAIPASNILTDFFAAIAKVETNGTPQRGQDNEIGTYQIRESYWIDSGVDGEFEQCWNDIYARQVMLGYWQRYCPKALSDLDFETLARIHNGGPKGAIKDCTKSYWKKIKESFRQGF